MIGNDHDRLRMLRYSWTSSGKNCIAESSFGNRVITCSVNPN
jgi:hypothetical protein